MGLAWLCAAWSPRSSLSDPYWPDNQDRRWWHEAAPTFGPAPTRVALSHGFGVSDSFMWYEAPGNPAIGNNGFRLRTGWPLRSMEGGKLVDRGNRRVEQWFLVQTPALWPFRPHDLPLKPIWAGAIANSAIFACVAFLGMVLTSHLRRRLRIRRGRCPECRHPIGSSTECSECGISLRPRRRAASRS